MFKNMIAFIGLPLSASANAISFPRTPGLLFAAILCFQACNVNAATLVINSSGILTGAQNVEAAGEFWDVEFRDDGDFYDVFGSPPTFDAVNETLAGILSLALMNQVFLDSSLGLFDTNPHLIAGCENTTTNACIAATPFEINGFGQRVNNPNLFFAYQAINYDTSGVGVDSTRDTAMPTNTTFGEFSGGVLARWSPSEVPLPAAAWLFGSALLGLGVIKRKKT